VKLLFDENVSPRLVDRVALEFPGSEHVRNVGLRASEDQQLWEYARAHAFAIVSKDTDFTEARNRRLRTHGVALSARPTDGTVSDVAYISHEPLRRPRVHLARGVIVRSGR
jgi:hypothetical protein